MIGEAADHELDALPLRFFQRAASFLDKQGDDSWACRFHRKIADSHSKSAAALHSLVRLADFAQKEGDGRGAREALRRAREHPECSGDWRTLVEKKLVALDA